MVGTFVSKRQLAEKTWEYTFSYSETIYWNPGDYTYISLTPGKFSDSRGLRRHISIVNLPTPEKKLIIAVRLRQSAFKHSLHALVPGDTIEFTPPYGELRLPKNETVRLVFIVGGIGITAILNVLEYLKKQRRKNPVTLLYFNKSKSTAVYLDEINTFNQTVPSFNCVVSMTSDETFEGEKGRISEHIIKKYIPDIRSSYFYSTGPDAMNQQVEEILYDLNVPDKQVWREDFTGY